VINEDLIDLARTAGKSNVLVVDFPWQYDNKKTGGTFKSGASQHYPTMPLSEIGKLPLDRVLQKNAVIFCWVPVPLSYEIARSGIFEPWGWEFKTKVFWEKEGRLLLGHWFRGQMEECWLFKRGKVTPFHSSKRNVIHCPVGKHSQKPEELFVMVEEECDKYRLNDRLELFARGCPRPGWMAYGNEVYRG
jgi:site-specific DNA-methyltransferase (adenine-specific)